MHIFNVVALQHTLRCHAETMEKLTVITDSMQLKMRYTILHQYHQLNPEVKPTPVAGIHELPEMN